LRLVNFLLKSHNKTTRNAAAAIPPTVPPTIVAVDGFVLGLTGSAIVCPVGWLSPDMMLPLRLLGDVLVAVGIAAMPSVESDTRDVACAITFDCVPLGIDPLTTPVDAESGVEIGAAIIRDAGKDADIEEGAATDTGITDDAELAAGVGVEAGELEAGELEAGELEAGELEAGELEAAFAPAADTATFVG
jgi:hypothetical protein